MNLGYELIFKNSMSFATIIFSSPVWRFTGWIVIPFFSLGLTWIEGSPADRILINSSPFNPFHVSSKSIIARGGVVSALRICGFVFSTVA
ncbi:MAG: hypothetical protein CM1200mP38_0200 [Dehalococcoidia bacterium]|nr:MAG: hypothetical protein CM1200mP38_0200 [Dehalococcoidia bacterium]